MMAGTHDRESSKTARHEDESGARLKMTQMHLFLFYPYAWVGIW
jgi:hypothetical protein